MPPPIIYWVICLAFGYWSYHNDYVQRCKKIHDQIEVDLKEESAEKRREVYNFHSGELAREYIRGLSTMFVILAVIVVFNVAEELYYFVMRLLK